MNVMLFRLTSAKDLPKDEIKKLEVNGFNLKFKQIDEDKTEYGGTLYRVSTYFYLFIEIRELSDLILISELLGYGLIISKDNDSKDYYSLKIINGCI